MSAPRSIGSRVRVTAPARLHLGFLDLSGKLPRRFGSVGLALDYPCTGLTVARGAGVTVEGPDAERARAYAVALLDELNPHQGVRIVVDRAIPPHAGLGSGTQLALAVGKGITTLFDTPVSSRDIAAKLKRGARSGIGIGAFEHGGFLIDGGTGSGSCPPPLITHMMVPEAWRVLLIFDDTRSGLSGLAERQAFSELPDFAEADAGSLCRMLLMEALPGLAEADIRTFGRAITTLQKRIGDYFAPVQGGRFSSPDVADVLTWASQRGVAGYGQSSWGPTGFALCENEQLAAQLKAHAEKRWRENGALRFVVCRPRNVAGEVLWDDMRQTSLRR